MKITVKTTDAELLPGIEEYLNQKINGLDKFLDGMDSDIIEARVEIGKTTKHHQAGEIFRAEVNLRLPGRILRSEAEELNWRTAIDRVKEELEIEIKKYRGKKEAQYKRGARVAKKLLRLSPLLWFRKKGRDWDEGI